MKLRSPLTLFPMLSIMVAAAGTLAFIAMTLALLQGRQEHEALTGIPVRVAFVGAPSKAAAVSAECRAEGVTLHVPNAPARFFPLDRVRREAAIVRDLHERSANQAGGALTRDQEWLFFKAVIERDTRLKGTLTLALHQIEMGNLKGDPGAARLKTLPVLLVSTDGLPSYELVSYLLESTSRMPVETEPLLPGWAVQAALLPPGSDGSAGRPLSGARP
jgi:hypothetical protein